MRCFGTEDRRSPAETIAATSEVYGQIVFRGGDIKDLQVNEQPPAAAPAMSDPAILSATVRRRAAIAAPLPDLFDMCVIL